MLSGAFARYGQTSFFRQIEKQIAGEKIRPVEAKCLPPSLINDKNLGNECRKALAASFLDLQVDDIKRVMFRQKKWRISRNEFTAFIDYRYMFTEVLIHSRKTDQYYIVEIVFAQNNRFLGYFWDQVSYKSTGFARRIKKENINRVCKD